MSARKEVLYRNAKTLLANPAKRVWFRLNPLLEKTSYFASRQLDNSQFTLPLQSVVVCEKFLGDKPAFQSTCTEADFWDYLWSENWRGWGSVRVFEGQLMDTLLEALHRLEELKVVVSHQTAVFTDNVRYRKRPLKGSKGVTKIQETLKISFTYYGRRTPADDLLLSSTACSSATMSVPGFDDTVLSDEEHRPSDSDQGHGQDTPAMRTGNGQESGSEGDSQDEDEHEWSTEPDSQQQKVNLTSPYTSYKDWISSRSVSTSSEDRSPYQHTMYSLPHFRVSRPSRQQGDDASLSTRQDQASVCLVHPEPDFNLWLMETMTNMKESGGRVIDRFRRRLKEIIDDRNSKKQKPKHLTGQHFAAVVRMMDNYERQKVAVPNMHRCEKVPTFRQYIIQIVEDRTFDPRFRNKRRIHKFSKRYNLHSSSDYSIGIEKNQEQSSKDSTKKSSRCKKPKADVGIFKPRKSPSRTNIFSKTPPPKSPVQVIEEKIEEPKMSHDFVDIVVAITDCKAFREPLSDVTKVAEVRDTTTEQSSSPASLRAGLPTSSQRGSSATRLGERSDGGKQRQKSNLSSGFKTSASTMTHGTDSAEGGLAGSYKSRNKHLTGESLQQSKEPSKLRVGKRKRKPHANLEEDGHYESSEGNYSPVGQSGTPDTFNARKLNRKYSFEKLKECKSSFSKPRFREVLKKFMKVQKVAAVFRKGAMFKPKKLRKQFQNPLHMSPSPEASMQFIAKRSGRRQALVADIKTYSFSHPSSDDFRDQLLKALDEFVVRKEHIISTYKNRSVMSLTFTRPEIFGNTEI